MALARVLAHAPRLVVIDDPIQGVDLLERDGLLALLRSLADDGIAVLASTADATGLSGADQRADAERRRAARPAAAGARACARATPLAVPRASG